MTREEHLLVIALEECAELSQEITKALRFGLDNHHPNTHIPNRSRISKEFIDLLAVMNILQSEGYITQYVEEQIQIDVEAKQRKIEHWLTYSKSVGRYTYKEKVDLDNGHREIPHVPQSDREPLNEGG